MKNVIDTLIDQYKKSGLLIRTNDGQLPLTPNDINGAIKNIVIDPKKTSDKKSTDLLSLLQNESPPYSSSLLSGINAPLLWYNTSFSEAFPRKDKKARKMGNRTLIAIIFKNNKVVLRGGCAWDADSNLRDLGNIPNSQIFNKSTPSSIFSQLSVFNNIGNYKYSGPTSNNNNPIYNPLFLPRTGNNLAMNEKEVDQFLNNVGSFKKTWVETLRKDAGGYNRKFGQYLTDTYGTGLEPEILTEPNNNQPYYEKKFDVSDILCVAFITDGKVHNTKSLLEYQDAAFYFLETATGLNGWINREGPDGIPLDSIPLVSITEVALPPIPLSGTLTPTGSVGCEWVKYLTCPGYKYQNPLKPTNFKLIE